ncbi:unnamed protein product [Caenorhabditis angaria]|uniref:Abnormal cell migration protein 18-like fibronectin type I domain-containing protein n=1 Tax=Caenorhabditis angaria TaxID=860376 RepID=A0A9P1N9P5_9PELO|nr:unnamed protein product [Caenorhabditis angaria]
MRNFVLLLATTFFVNGCVYKGNKYQDKETWIVRSTFILRCDINKTGWKTTVVGCRTDQGVQVLPGQTVHEKDTKYECLKDRDGTVEIRRTLNIKRTRDCGDHTVGDSWVYEKNFLAKCTEKGVQVLDLGLNTTAFLTKMGKISIHRDVVTQQLLAPRPTTLSPIEILGPMFKKFGDIGGVLQQKLDTEKEEVSASEQMVEAPAPTCDFEGEVRRAGDVWISDGIFTKKCTEDGATVILNCIVDEKTIIAVDTELTIGKRTYKCYRKPQESRVYYEVRIN